MKTTLFGIFLVLCGSLWGQFQNIRGKVVDNETQFPLKEALVVLDLNGDGTFEFTSKTGMSGDFILSEVPVGRYTLEITCDAYDAKSQTVEVTSG
ncbi:MAG: carboxypeptidase-like regulatory domain-containing protein, partial [Flavobacteriales bacterium]